MVSKKSRPSSRTSTILKTASALVVLGSLIYGAYSYISSSNDTEGEQQRQQKSNHHHRHHHSHTKAPKTLNPENTISLVITSQNTNSEKNIIRLIRLFITYPNLTFVLHPSITKHDLIQNLQNELIHQEREDDILLLENETFRFIKTLKEESIFHVLKHIGSTYNFINLNDELDSTRNQINDAYHLDKFLSNIIYLDDSDSIEDYI